MKQYQQYCFCFSLFLILACGSTKNFPLVPDFMENNRSSEINKRLDRDRLIRFLDYRAYKDSLIEYYEKDSVLNPGILMPRSSNLQVSAKWQMQFGNDSSKCIIRYRYSLKYYYTGHSAALDVIDILWKKKDSSEQYRSYELMSMKVEGMIQSPMFKDEIPFMFEEDKRAVDNSTGQLVISNDTLLIKPVSEFFKILEKQSLSEKTKKSVAAKTIVGLRLVKDSIVYAVLERYPQKLYSNDKIALYNKAATAEQMVIAAYFAAIEKFW